MSGRLPGRGALRHYPRTARVNAVLQEVVAEQLERMEDHDSDLGMLTVTAVDCDADLRHATVLVASLGDEAREALERARPRLQAAVAREVRLKRTPQLSFRADPAVASGERVEEILRKLRES